MQRKSWLGLACVYAALALLSAAPVFGDVGGWGLAASLLSVVGLTGWVTWPRAARLLGSATR